MYSGTQRFAAPCPRPARSGSRSGAALRCCGVWAAAVEQLPAAAAPRWAQLPLGVGAARGAAGLCSRSGAAPPRAPPPQPTRDPPSCARGGRGPLGEAGRRERRQRVAEGQSAGGTWPPAEGRAGVPAPGRTLQRMSEAIFHTSLITLRAAVITDRCSCRIGALGAAGPTSIAPDPVPGGGASRPSFGARPGPLCSSCSCR